MGRRPSLITAINRAINQAEVAERRRQREANVNYAIKQSSGPKEMAPTFQITSFDFNEDTRACKIEFLQTTKYRKIERYVTQNYVRHPIYSDWKTKTKVVKKSVKLTDENLELLENYDDELISEFATEIVDRINNDEFYPSWYLKDLITFDINNRIAEFTEKRSSNKKLSQEYLRNLDNDIKKCQNYIDLINSKSKKNKKLEEKSKKIIDKIDASSKPIILKIITLGIYAAMVSKKRYEKHTFLYKYYKKLNQDNINDIANLNAIINLYDAEKKNIDSLMSQTNKYCDGKIAALQEEHLEMINLVVPLTEF